MIYDCCPGCDGEGWLHACCDDMCRANEDAFNCHYAQRCETCKGHGSVCTELMDEKDVEALNG